MGHAPNANGEVGRASNQSVWIRKGSTSGMDELDTLYDLETAYQ